MIATTAIDSPSVPLRGWTWVLVLLGAASCFHAAFLKPSMSWLILGFLGGLFALRRLGSARKAFYVTLGLGLACYAPHLGFLWNIFGPAAIPLWLILPFWLAVFSLTVWQVDRRFGVLWSGWLAPVIWAGVEYFRCEVWWLRFSWLSAGSVLPDGFPLLDLGVFGAGIALFGFAAALVRSAERGFRSGFLAILGVLAGVGILISADTTLRPRLNKPEPHRTVAVAGLQMEFPSMTDLMGALDRTIQDHPSVELIVLPEYTFEGEPPEVVRNWCRIHTRWLIAGGKDFLSTVPGTNASPAHALLRPAENSEPKTENPFRNTAFVIGTNGQVVFTQAKSQPIQFFNDGLPAESQRLWNSPWGPIGIAICYDASYRRVSDELVRQGARALLFPTMDVEQWGAYEHGLNARQARLRAREYQLPVLRVASSGPSQLISARGSVERSTSIPGQGETVAGTLVLRDQPNPRPLDHWIAPLCTGAWAAIAIGLVRSARRSARTGPQPVPIFP
jgi:apolipoprotein N-acyltransferase